MWATRETKTKYALFVLIARQVHESIEHSTPWLKIRGNLCDNCVVVFIVSQLLVGIIEHSLHFLLVAPLSCVPS